MSGEKPEVVVQQEPLQGGNRKPLVPVDVRVVLVQAEMERSRLSLRRPMVRPPRLREGRAEPLCTLRTGKLKGGSARKEVARQRLDDLTDVALVEVIQAAQCFSSSFSTGARLRIRRRSSLLALLGRVAARPPARDSPRRAAAAYAARPSAA